MFRRSLLISLVLLSHLQLAAQCPNGDIVLFTQEGVDNFPNDFPNCTELQGNLSIGTLQTASDIDDLNSLANIRSIEGDLLIYNNDELTSLEGLEQITTIGGSLEINFNNLLPSIDHLPSLVTIGGDLDVVFNINLQRVINLDQLISIDGDVRVGGSPLLQTIAGLQQVESIGGTLDIFGNDQLSSLAGLNSLNNIGGGLFLSENQSLADISALNNIQFIGGNLALTEIPQLQNLDALNELSVVNGNLFLIANNALNDISGLRNIEPAGINNLEIQFNPNLSDCAIQSVCQYLQFENGPAIIANNADGCSSREEVEMACPLVGNNCFDAILTNNLFGAGIDQPQTSVLFNNTPYSGTNSPNEGVDCFLSTTELITNSIWFQFTGDGNTYQITTIECGATDYIDNGDTQLALYQGDCDNLTPVTCNENADDDLPLLNGQITIATEVGVEYFLLVDGTTSPASDGTGEYCLEVTQVMLTEVMTTLANDFKIFPNPTSGLVHTQGPAARKVNIFNSQGRLLGGRPVSHNSFDLSDLPAGLYYAHFSTAEGYYTARVVKVE